MQHIYLAAVYVDPMPAASKPLSRLKALREKAGISQRELARLLEVHHSNVSFWERSGVPPRSDLLPQMARLLGVTVDELLGEPKVSKPRKPQGKAGQVFEQVAKLPRRQQERILGVVEDMLARHQAKAS
jgi:transcriptional regulator with XRE-family HTH domain